jgi:hypothetical protein
LNVRFEVWDCREKTLVAFRIHQLSAFVAKLDHRSQLGIRCRGGANLWVCFHCLLRSFKPGELQHACSCYELAQV